MQESTKAKPVASIADLKTRLHAEIAEHEKKRQADGVSARLTEQCGAIGTVALTDVAYIVSL